MIKTTEELKREMYGVLANLGHLTCKAENQSLQPGESATLEFQLFQNGLEAYLEALRQERDDLRNRLQAFEFANKSAGDLLRDALATVKRQREFIRTLYASRKARKSKKATRIQSSDENAAETICGPLLSLCQHSWRDQFADLSGKAQKQCIFCQIIQEI